MMSASSLSSSSASHHHHQTTTNHLTTTTTQAEPPPEETDEEIFQRLVLFRRRQCETLDPPQLERLWQGLSSSGNNNNATTTPSNLVAAIEYCQELGLPERATAIASGIWRHWFERGYLNEARRLLEPASEPSHELTPEIRARALKGLGSIARFQKDVSKLVLRKHLICHGRAFC